MIQRFRDVLRFTKETVPLTDNQLFNRLRTTPVTETETRKEIATDIIKKFDSFTIDTVHVHQDNSVGPYRPIVVTATLDERFPVRFVQQLGGKPYWQISYTESGFPTVSLGTHGFGVVVEVGDISFDLSKKDPNEFIHVSTDSDDTNRILNEAGVKTHLGDAGIWEFHRYYVNSGYEKAAREFANRQIAKLETNIVKIAEKGTSPVSAHRCFNASF